VKRLEMRPKHPLAIRWCHWVNFPLLALMIWSGLWIYWANDVYRLGLGSFTLFRFFPESFYRTFGVSHELAKGMAWHFFFMWFFTLNGIVYVAYTLFSGEWRYLVPSRESFREAILVALHDLRVWKGQLPQRKYNGAQQIAYTSIIVMGFASLVTGLAIYKPIQFAWLTGLLGGYTAARFEHFWLAIGYVLFFVVHIAQVLRAGWNNFRAMVSGYELVASEENAHE
jgi:thiosulfate reductase cytochrome b subunit